MAESSIGAERVTFHPSLLENAFVLGEALGDLVEHFRWSGGGMSQEEATALAHQVLNVDPAEWAAAWAEFDRRMEFAREVYALALQRFGPPTESDRQLIERMAHLPRGAGDSLHLPRPPARRAPAPQIGVDVAPAAAGHAKGEREARLRFMASCNLGLTRAESEEVAGIKDNREWVNRLQEIKLAHARRPSLTASARLVEDVS